MSKQIDDLKRRIVSLETWRDRRIREDFSLLLKHLELEIITIHPREPYEDAHRRIQKSKCKG